jgi:predicted ATPase
LIVPRGTPLVGRGRELATLTERLEAAERGEGGVVLIAGEPGIGKTRLLNEHVSNILSETGLANRTEAAVYAHGRALV